MNAPLLIANLLTLVIFLGHAVMGDKELQTIAPGAGDDNSQSKMEAWVHTRAHLHIVSASFLLATVVLGLVNFTDWFPNEEFILKSLSVYFVAYSAGFLFSIVISRPFPNKFRKLYHWILLLIIGGLIYWGSLP